MKPSKKRCCFVILEEFVTRRTPFELSVVFKRIQYSVTIEVTGIPQLQYLHQCVSALVFWLPGSLCI